MYFKFYSYARLNVNVLITVADTKKNLVWYYKGVFATLLKIYHRALLQK